MGHTGPPRGLNAASNGAAAKRSLESKTGAAAVGALRGLKSKSSRPAPGGGGAEPVGVRGGDGKCAMRDNAASNGTVW